MILQKLSLLDSSFLYSHNLLTDLVEDVDMPDEEKDKRGIDEFLIRLSIGIENYSDIEADIIKALTHSKVGVISWIYQ